MGMLKWEFENEKRTKIGEKIFLETVGTIRILGR